MESVVCGFCNIEMSADLELMREHLGAHVSDIDEWDDQDVQSCFQAADNN